MTRNPRSMADPLAAQIELALQPDAFIPDAACSAFVSHLDEVAARIAPLSPTAMNG